MAIQLYRAGNSHTVRGIECELINCTINSLSTMLDEGWLKSPEDIGHDAQDKEVRENDKESAQEESQNEKEDAEKALNPVRQAAKDAGIEGWDIKRIKTLEGLLNELKD